MLREVLITEPVTSENEPDGSTISIVDPYIGCTIGCPYCFRLSNVNWKGNIIVNKNIAEKLDLKLHNMSKLETIYLGSLCDPYIDIENEYELTKKCLEVLDKHNIPTMITTKSDNDLILRDFDLIKNFSADMTVLMGISNMKQLKNANNGMKNHNIELSNKLNRAGIKVWAFITPIMPYIISVDDMINEFDKDIPIILDLLRVEKDSIQSKQIKKYIAFEYPHLIDKYNDIIDNNNLNYYYDLREKYKNNNQITFMYYES